MDRETRHAESSRSERTHALLVLLDLAKQDLAAMDARRHGRAAEALLGQLGRGAFFQNLPRANLEQLGLRAEGVVEGLPGCKWAWGPVTQQRRGDPEAFWLALFRTLDDVWVDVLAARLGYRNLRSALVPAGNPVADAATRLNGLWQAVSRQPTERGPIVIRTILRASLARTLVTVADRPSSGTVFHWHPATPKSVAEEHRRRLGTSPPVQCSWPRRAGA